MTCLEDIVVLLRFLSGDYMEILLVLLLLLLSDLLSKITTSKPLGELVVFYVN